MSKILRIGKRVTASLLSILTLTGMTVGTVRAVPEITYPDSVSNVLVSDDKAVFNVDRASVDGDIYAHDSIEYYGFENMTVNGCASSGSIDEKIKASSTDNERHPVPELSNAIEKNADYAHRYAEDTVISEKELDISESMYIDGNLTLDEVSLSGQGYITAEKDISCYLIEADTTSGTLAVISSKDGDIIINGSDLTFEGVIYAPNGKVIFNVKNLTLNGSIYAEDVEFNGTELKLCKREKYDDLVTEHLSVEAGEDRDIYIGDSIALEGSSNYEGVSFRWSGDESISFENADSQKTSASFDKVGTYTLTLTGTLRSLSDSDSLTVTVKPDPTKTFTTTEDFSEGELTGTAAKDGSLMLDREKPAASAITKKYLAESVSGVNVDSKVSKDKITSASDSFEVTYDLSGTGSNTGDGIDFAFVIDNSGSMSGAYLQNAIEAAKTIMTYMRPGDRFAISDLGKVHIGFTDDKEKLETEIDNVGRGSGSSEPDDGINLANKLFDEQSTPERQKYIILLADGEACDGDYSMDTMKKYSQDAANRNIRIFSLAMRNDIQNMQEAAIITKGIYKNAPDGETIKKFMERFGAEIFNAAARNVLFKTTVADKSTVDFESLSPAPSDVTDNPNGSVDLVWSFDSFEIDEIRNINIPISSETFKESGYEKITYDTALYYNDKEGKGQKTYLDDITLPCETFRDNGTWSAVYDSKRENCRWTGIYWNAVYPSDSSADIYVAASDDGKSFTKNERVNNYTVPENLKGRYIRVTAQLHKASDGSTPVIEDITVISGNMELKKPFETSISADIDMKNTVFANRPVTLYAGIKSNSDSVKNISWSISGTENYTLDDSDSLRPTVIFREKGTFAITLNIEDFAGGCIKKTVNIDVSEEENVSDIIFDDGTSVAPVKYTVECIGLKAGVDNYYNNTRSNPDRVIKLVTDDPSSISWASVRIIPDEKVNINRYNDVYVYHVNEDLTCAMSSFPYLKQNFTLEIVAYDWGGQPYRSSFYMKLDNEAPSIEINRPESAYSNGRFYTEDPFTVSVSAYDNYEIDRVVLTLNNEEVPLDENNSFTFTPTEPGSYNFVARVYDKAGNTNSKNYSPYINKDTRAPSFKEFKLNTTSASIGNEIIFTCSTFDAETGLKSVVCTVNDKEITLDENGEYKFTAEEAGEFIFKAVAEDNRGNKAERSQKLTVTEDTRKPSVKISATRSGSILVDTEAVVTVDASDNVAVTKIDVDVNGKSQPLDENDQFVLAPKEVGNVVITASAYDNAGNKSTATFRLTVIAEDKNPPSLQFYPSAKYEYSDRTMSVYVNSSDNVKVASRELYLDEKKLENNGKTNGTPEYLYTDYYEFNTFELGLGNHTFKAVTTDSSGNKTEVEKAFTVNDTYAPAISFEGSNYFNTGDTAVLTLKITDLSELESVTGTLNGESISLKNTGEQTLTIENAPAGTYEYSVTARDASGNERTATKKITVRDTVKPVITISDVKEEYLIPEVPVIRVTVTDNTEVASVTARMNNKEITLDGDRLVIPEELPEGKYTITVTARDKASNTATETVVFNVSMPKDTTPPVIEEVSLIPEYPEAGSPIKVIVKASDDSGNVTVEVSTDGKKFTYEDGAYVYTPTETGEITVTIKASDPSGNVTEISAVGYVSADNTPPVVTVDYRGSMKLGQKQTITVEASDNKAIAGLSLNVNGENAVLSNGKYEFAPKEKGEYRFTAIASDSFGNIGTKEFTVTVTEDEEADYSEYLKLENELSVETDVKNQADELKTAAAVYEYVKNNIRPQFYQNLRKGAEETFRQNGGNDTDTAALLIAMLRYLKYPARYVTGTVQYSDEELIALTGAKDYDSAVNCINASGYDSQSYYTPSGNKLIRIAHTWVEAYVPLSECGVDSTDKSWVTLDGWNKKINVMEQSAENNDIGYGKASGTILSTIDSIEKDKDAPDRAADIIQGVKGYFNEVKDNAEKSTSFRFPVIEQTTVEKLPKSPEFTIVNRSGDSVFADQNIIDTVTLKLGSSEAVKFNAYEAASKRVVVQYLPYDETAQAAFDKVGGDYTLTGTSLSVVPCITVDGEVVSRGSRTTLGQNDSLTITLSCNGKTKTVTDSLIAGSTYAVVTNLYDIAATDLMSAYLSGVNSIYADISAGPYSDSIMGTALDLAGKLYFARNDIYEFDAACMYNTAQNPDISVGIFGYEFGVNYNGWTGQVTGNLKTGSFMTDIDIMKSTPVSLEGNDDDKKAFIMNTGMMSSYYEGAIWTVFVPEAKPISTVSVLGEAIKNGTGIAILNSTNKSTLYSLSLSDDVISDIASHIDKGYTVTVSKKNVTIGQWTGTGYMMVKPDTLEENVFRLSGGINGGTMSDMYSMQLAKTEDRQTLPLLDENTVSKIYSLTVGLATLNLEMAIASTTLSVYSGVATGGTVGLVSGSLGMADSLLGVACSSQAIFTAMDLYIDYATGEELAAYELMDLMMNQVLSFVWGIFSLGTSLIPGVSDVVLAANLTIDSAELTVDFDPYAYLSYVTNVLEKLLLDEKTTSELKELAMVLLDPKTGIPSVGKS